MAQVSFPFPDWPWQKEAVRQFRQRHQTGTNRFLFRVARQIGKTALLQALAIDQSLKNPGHIYWYVAPSYDRCEVVYTELCNALGQLIAARVVTPKKLSAGFLIRFGSQITGGELTELHLKSLGNPELLRGPTLDGLLGDEVGLWDGYVWRSILMPMLLVKNAWAVLAGTPPDPFTCKDPEFMPGLTDKAAIEDGWWEIHRTYHHHPLEHVRKAIEDEKKTMPSDEFGREYMAEYTDRDQIKLPAYRIWGKELGLLAPDGMSVGTTIDLADNEMTFGDKAAVVTSGVSSDQNLWVMGANYAKNPSEVLDLCYLHKDIYGAQFLGIQNSSYDKGFRYTVEQAERTRGPLNAVPITIGGTSKFRRIMNVLEPHARQGKVFIHEDCRDLMNEWETFPKGLLGDTRRNPHAHHFDLLDALSGRGEHLFKAAGWVPPEPTPANSWRSAKAAVMARKRGRSSQYIHWNIFRI